MARAELAPEDLGWKRINEEVYYGPDPCVVGPGEIGLLARLAGANRRRRVRLCAHSDVADAVHEMVIVHSEGAYVRPHRHLDKSESFHVMAGEMLAVFLDDAGRVAASVRLGAPGSGLPFYLRVSDGAWHTIVPVSSQVVFHETTKGPFAPGDTVFADFAPPEEDAAAARRFLDTLYRELSPPRP